MGQQNTSGQIGFIGDRAALVSELAAALRDQLAPRQAMDIKEAAKMLNISERHLRALVAKRQIPFFKVSGSGDVRFWPRDLENWEGVK